jgi:hypothetical protein
VQLFGALEAEGVPAHTVYHVCGVKVRDPLDSVVALSTVRTPLHVLVVISERHAVPPQVFLQSSCVLLVRKNFKYEGMSDDYSTTILLALSSYSSLRPTLDQFF